MLIPKKSLALPSALIVLMLTACGGGGSDSSSSGTTPVETSKFTKTATWKFELPASGSLCFDFDNNIQTTDCTGTAWDLKATGANGAASFWTNSGSSGAGTGGALFGLMNWSDLLTWKKATVSPTDASVTDLSSLYTSDSASGIFSQQTWYEYDLEGTHLIYPNDRVYLITGNNAAATATSTDDAPVYALQIIGYYGGTSGTSGGYPTIRWIDRQHPDVVHTQQINASSYTSWVYFDLKNGAIVSTVSDADAASAANANTWHIAFQRTLVKLNGGVSGSGKAAGFLGKTPAGFYGSDGSPVKSKFESSTNPADTLVDLTASDMATPATASKWVKDSNNSLLNPPVTYDATAKTYNYGLYTYLSATHFLTANDGMGALIRSGTGGSYARAHLSSLVYADSANPSSQTTWTISFDVQPATSSP